jgi:hypothetical protein
MDGGGGGASQCTLYRCALSNNYASPGGGGAFLYSVAYNCLIVSNAGLQGGGAKDSTLYNCTVFNNASDDPTSGGGLYSCTNINGISWSNNPAAPLEMYPDAWKDYGTTESYSCGVGYTGTGSITNDPLLDANYRLSAGSPCINTGTNGAWTTGARDLDGNQRIWPRGGTVDMGAYEYGSEAEYPAGPAHIYIRGASAVSVRGTGASNVRGYVE